MCWRMLKSGAEIRYWSIFCSWFSYSLLEYAKHGSHFWSSQNCSRSSQFALSLKFNFQWCSWWFVELANIIASLWLWSNVGFLVTQWDFDRFWKFAFKSIFCFSYFSFFDRRRFLMLLFNCSGVLESPEEKDENEMIRNSVCNIILKKL